MATSNGKPPTNHQSVKSSKPEKKGSNLTKGSCLCGFRHAYAKCFHLTDTSRPYDWLPKANIIKKIRSILANPQNRPVVEGRVKEKNVSLRLAEPSEERTNQGHLSSPTGLTNVNYMAGIPLPAPMSLAESFPYLPRPWSFHLSSVFNAAAASNSNLNHPIPDYALRHSFIYDSGSVPMLAINEIVFSVYSLYLNHITMFAATTVMRSCRELVMLTFG